MLASNFNTIQNHFLLEETQKLIKLEIIDQNQYEKIKKEIITTKTNSNILVRIGFFLLGNFLISIILSTYTLFLYFGDNFKIYGSYLFILGILGVFISEILRNKKYFSYGLDDSFILSIPLFFGTSIALFTESINLVFITIILTSLISTIRYVHTPSVFISLISFTSYMGYLVIEKKIIPFFLFPILFFILALVIYLLLFKIEQHIKYFIYKNVIFTAKIFSVLLAYASFNYFLVKELSNILVKNKLSNTEEMPLATLFYIATFFIPIFYIFYGLKIRDRIFFCTGLLSLGLSFETIRYYYFLPTEYVLLLTGIILFIIVYFSIQKIKNNTKGITFKEDKNLNPMTFDLIKAILINTHVNASTAIIQKSPIEFGGGDFSGGGSGESF
ncbi:hypothetical protein EH230_07175 [Flavobacterium columnare]|uniref:DUF2157 domain-containing protein n=1 Tax=Flavobacterium columnare TaxID=996 RepID=A0A437UB05_9FLAO|nr:hypothetical protein [Flavobacterium columnare]RVU90688.1 hypothetical protein EH230_07175 [Flavobacterium columnare]